MLKKMGYRVDVVTDGKKGLLSMEKQPYDLVFMDVEMPEMGDLKASREIRRLWTQGPKILAITVYVLAGDLERCLETGMDDYVAKPVQKGRV
jgi:CheY-like chemotaxis protein